jgi:hypothetical protein
MGADKGGGGRIEGQERGGGARWPVGPSPRIAGNRRAKPERDALENGRMKGKRGD